jgi:hypothetical protein
MTLPVAGLIARGVLRARATTAMVVTCRRSGRSSRFWHSDCRAIAIHLMAAIGKCTGVTKQPSKRQ